MEDFNLHISIPSSEDVTDSSTYGSYPSYGDDYLLPHDPSLQGSPPTPALYSRDQPNTIHFICEGIIIPIGLFVNILACAVFMTSRSLRHTTTGHYLLALSIADTLFLVGEFVRWLSTPDVGHLGWHVDFLDKIDVLCKAVMSLRYGTKLASAWLTVVIAIERFVTVAFPLKVVTISTPKIAKVTICVIFLVSIVGGCFPMWTVGIEVYSGVSMCVVYQAMLPMYNVFNWIFLRVGSLIIPGILISAFSVLITVNLKKAKHMRERRLSGGNILYVNAKTTHRFIERQLTMMLLAVALAFVFLRLPYTTAYYLHSYRGHIYGTQFDPYITYQLYYAMKIGDIFVAVNYASNFFLYYLCGSSFRKQLSVLFRRKRGRRYSRETASSLMTMHTVSFKGDHGKHTEVTTNGSRGVITSLIHPDSNTAHTYKLEE